MSNITTAFAEGYHHAVELNLQQRGSKLEKTVRCEVQNVERYYYDKIGPTEAVDVISRHADTPLVETRFDRRAVTLISADWGDLVDRADQIKMLNDPTSSYAINAAYALGRKKDQRILWAALGKAQSGKKGEKTIDFDPNQRIAANYQETTATTNTGLTIDKLRMAREMLDDADVDDMEEQFVVLSAKQMSNLLRTTEITSSDYNTVRALVNGSVDSFLGFKFIRVSSTLLPKKDDIRSVLIWAKSGILMATSGDITTTISTRNDKRGATQVYASLDVGATRLDERKVIEVLCDETK